MLTSLGALYARGVSIDWHGFERDYVRRRVALPTYPFQRQRYWVEAPRAVRGNAVVGPLIDRMIASPSTQTTLFETAFSVETLPFLADHLVYGAVVSPGAAQIALALSAAQLSFEEPGVLCLDDLILPQALVIPTGATRTVQALFTHEADDHAFTLLSFAAEGERTVTTHATGRALRRRAALPTTLDLVALQRSYHEPVDLAVAYDALADAQIALGPSFRWVAEAWRGEQAALARLVRPEAVASLDGYTLHPGLLDACFQVVGFAQGATGETLLPFALERLTFHAAATGEAWWCHVQAMGEQRWRIQLLDATGTLLVEVEGFQLRAAPAAQVTGERLRREWLQTLTWVPTPFSAAAGAGAPSCRLLLGGSASLAEALATQTPVVQLPLMSDPALLQRTLTELTERHAALECIVWGADAIT
jgi:acyl transferase domain-containing protein